MVAKSAAVPATVSGWCLPQSATEPAGLGRRRGHSDPRARRPAVVCFNRSPGGDTRREETRWRGPASTHSLPGRTTYLLLVGTGLCGGAAHIAMTVSFRQAEASLLAPFEYLTLLWAMFIGVVFFAETPGAAFLVAAPLVIAGAVLASPEMGLRIFWRARRLRNAKHSQ